MLTKANSRLSECNYRAENDGVEWKAFRWLGHVLVPKCLKVWERRRVPKRPDRIAEVGRLSLNVPECEINSAADSLLSFRNPVLREPGFVFVANTRALALSASVFREVVYDFRELASVAHASRTSTPRIVERIMRATGGLNIAQL